MNEIQLDMYQTAGVGVLALLLGMFLTRKIPFLKRFCIPAAVSGGIIFSLIALAMYSWGHVELSFDGTLKDICMMLFFTSVGFQSNLKVLKQGGRPLLVMIVLVAVMIVVQNGLAVGIASALGLEPIIGMAAGSIPMSGGHGTAGGFSPLLESMGVTGAASISMAAATFGLVAGSLLGGPLAQRLIQKHDLSSKSDDSQDTMISVEANTASPESQVPHLHSEEDDFRRFSRAVYQMLIALAAGAVLSKLLSLTGITFPTYFGTLMVAAIMRNIYETVPNAPSLEIERIVSLGNVCLSLFLGMAMISLRFWELADLALPLITMLLAQVVFLGLFAYFVAFRALGKDYDAAVLVSGFCGFGLGATPNAMANMSAVCFKYQYTVKPFIIVPIMGAMFADIINTTVITLFLNIL